MVSITENQPLKLEYYLEAEREWCKLEIISKLIGRTEETVVITSLEQLPNYVHIKYLYPKSENVWFYDKVNKDDIRIKPGSITLM